MNTILKLETWADRHHPKWIEYLRIILGVILIIKGITLIINKEQVLVMMQKSNIDEFTFLVSSQFVIALYIAGGLLVSIGLKTRLIVFLQIPLITLSIIFINYHQGLFALNSELGYLILLLGLLFFFLFYGSGSLSVDNYLDKQKE